MAADQRKRYRKGLRKMELDEERRRRVEEKVTREAEMAKVLKRNGEVARRRKS